MSCLWAFIYEGIQNATVKLSSLQNILVSPCLASADIPRFDITSTSGKISVLHMQISNVTQIIITIELCCVFHAGLKNWLTNRFHLAMRVHYDNTHRWHQNVVRTGS